LKVLVTGATGLVGYHAVAHLLKKNIEVVALTRPTSNTSSLAALSSKGNLSLTACALTDRDALTQAMSGVDVVVHCAGAVDPHAKRQDIYAVNVDGTASALSAAIAAGVKQFIHISSLSVITCQQDQYMVDESAKLRHCSEAYADSKVDAELTVQKQGALSQTATTILRPGFIYGPGERAWLPRLIDSLAQGKVMLIDGGAKETNVIYVENLSRAIELALLNEKAYHQVFNLTDGRTPSKKQLFDTICDCLNLPRPTKKVPGFVARAACDLVSAIAPSLPEGPRQKLSRFSRAAYRLAGINQGFDIGKAERELGYTDRIPFAEGMAATLRSYGNAGKDKPVAEAVH
jgi:nucleoside-diphosphate-sugar epimerase